MQIKFWQISSLLVSLCLLIFISCSSGVSKGNQEEALALYNTSMAIAEDMTIRLTKTTNNLKIMDSRVSNSDTLNVYKLGQAYDDIENVKQLIKQWKRDVPPVSADPSQSSSIPAEEMLTKQKEFQEKVEYIRFRLDDLDKLLNDMMKGAAN